MSLKTWLIGTIIRGKLKTTLEQFKNVKASETQAAIAAVILKVACLLPACQYVEMLAGLLGLSPDELVRYLVYYIGTRMAYKFARAEAVPLGPPVKVKG